MQSLSSLPLPPSPLEPQLLSTPKFSKSRPSKSKSSLSHYPPPQPSSPSPSPLQSQQITTAFQSAHDFLLDVDHKISSFKKFNENKVTMRYEHLIKTLEKQITILKTRLSYEQNAKNPTKDYMKQLLDQLLSYKRENEKLKEEVRMCREIIKGNQKEIRESRVGIQSLQTSLKGKVERLPLISYSGSTVADLIAKFLEEKASIKELLGITGEETRLQKYLKEVQSKKPGWDMLKFLVEIDKWVQTNPNPKSPPNNPTPPPQIDIWKVRYAAIERFSKIRGESSSFTSTPREHKASSLDINKGRGSMKEQRVETTDKDNNNVKYEKLKLRKLKEKVLENFSSRKFSREQKL